MNRYKILSLFFLFSVLVIPLIPQPKTLALETGPVLKEWDKKPEYWDFLKAGDQYERKILLICDTTKLRQITCGDIAGILSKKVTEAFGKEGIVIQYLSSFRTKPRFSVGIGSKIGLVCGKEIIEVAYGGKDGDKNIEIDENIDAIQSVVKDLEKEGVISSPGAISGSSPFFKGTPAGSDWAVQAIKTPIPRLSGSLSRVAVLDTGVNDSYITGFLPMNFLGPNLNVGGSNVIDGFTNPYPPPAPSSISALSRLTRGHGTLVASIIRETGLIKNTGITTSTSIVPIKVCGDNGKCQLNSIVAGICAAVKAYPEVGTPVGPIADVLNLSFGSYVPSPILEGAIRDAISAGALVVAAAGNSRGNGLPRPKFNKTAVSSAEKDQLITDGFISKTLEVLPKAFHNPVALARIWGAPKPWNKMTPIEKDIFLSQEISPGVTRREAGRFNTPLYPAALSNGSSNADGLISVGSVSRFKSLFEFASYQFSDFSTQNGQIDMVAPGDMVLALQSDGKPTDVISPTLTLLGGSPAIGTSFSAAYVSGAAAVIISHRKRMGGPLSPVEVEQILLDSSDPKGCEPSPNDPANACGAGLLNVTKAFELAK